MQAQNQSASLAHFKLTPTFCKGHRVWGAGIQLVSADGDAFCLRAEHEEMSLLEFLELEDLREGPRVDFKFRISACINHSSLLAS